MPHTLLHAKPPGRPRSGRARACRRTRPGGFTLIEALVTIVVLAFGVLALAILQTQTLLDTRTASMRNVATAMAYNLADQIRANERALTAGTYSNLTANPKPEPVAACYTAAGCTPEQMALTSFAAWLDDVGAALPGGTGIVCIDSTPTDGTSPAVHGCDNVAGAPYVIKIWWREDSKSNDTPIQRFVTAVVP